MVKLPLTSEANKCTWMVLQDETVFSEALDKISAHAKLKLTIPREPELKTAYRAERMRLACLWLYILSRAHYTIYSRGVYNEYVLSTSGLGVVQKWSKRHQLFVDSKQDH